MLDAAGIQTLVAPEAGCCGAVKFHLNDQDGGLAQMRANIDAWWPHIEGGAVEAIVMNASGCGVTVREYGHLLRHDPQYADKAARTSALTRDLSELLPTSPRAAGPPAQPPPGRGGLPPALQRCSTASSCASGVSSTCAHWASMCA